MSYKPKMVRIGYEFEGQKSVEVEVFEGVVLESKVNHSFENQTRTNIIHAGNDIVGSVVKHNEIVADSTAELWLRDETGKEFRLPKKAVNLSLRPGHQVRFVRMTHENVYLWPVQVNMTTGEQINQSTQQLYDIFIKNNLQGASLNWVWGLSWRVGIFLLPLVFKSVQHIYMDYRPVSDGLMALFCGGWAIKYITSTWSQANKRGFDFNAKVEALCKALLPA